MISAKNFIDLEKYFLKEPISCDICIIGAGAIGIYIANQLSRAGFDTVLLDSGPYKSISTEKAGYSPNFENEIYKGSTLGRFFGLGGSTTNWGGALIPHCTNDLIGIGEADNVWEFVVKQIMTNEAKVLKNLGYPNEPRFEEKPNDYLGKSSLLLNQCGFNINSNLYLPFAKKNFSNHLTGNRNLRIIYNSTVNDWEIINLGQENRVNQLSAISKNNNKISVIAKKFIISAGAIESTRILLEIKDKYRNSFIESTHLGCFLSDHLSYTIADVDNTGDNIKKAIDLFAPRFDNSWMRGIRIIDNAANNFSARGFAHFIFSMESAGFKVLKSIFSSIQKKELPNISVEDLTNSPKDLFNLVLSRYRDSRLYINSTSPIKFQLDIEQVPLKSNCIKLSRNLDSFGRYRTLINWSISNDDYEQIESRAKSILDKWPNGNNIFPKLIPRRINFENNKPHDAYHPVGTSRMGLDRSSVVDLNHKVSSFRNLWSISTANLPTAGTANPTFTMLCLAENLIGNFIND